MPKLEKFVEFVYTGKCRICNAISHVVITESDARKVIEETQGNIPDFYFFCRSCEQHRMFSTMSFEECPSC